MIWSWIKRRRRDKLTGEPSPHEWLEHVERNVEHFAALSPDEQQELLAIIQVLVAEKHWEGCGGLELTDEMRVTVAAQAALLLLGLEHDYYRNVLSILVYPSGYQVPKRRQDGDDLLVADDLDPVLGQAHMGGPVILSWRHAKHGGADLENCFLSLTGTEPETA